MSNTNLVNEIKNIINHVFNNEEKFLKDFNQPGHSDSLLEFYMASERCRVSIMSTRGYSFTDTVKTQDVIDWVSSL